MAVGRVCGGRLVIVFMRRKYGTAGAAVLVCWHVCAACGTSALWNVVVFLRSLSGNHHLCRSGRGLVKSPLLCCCGGFSLVCRGVVAVLCVLPVVGVGVGSGALSRIAVGACDEDDVPCC